MKDSAAAVVKVGDTVRYIPSADHAREQSPEKVYPWQFGFKQQRQRLGPDGRWGWEDYVEILDDGRMSQIDHYLQGHANRAEEEKKLMLIRPIRTWRARVTAVNGDGTVNLDIDARWSDRHQCGNGFTLHYGPVTLLEHAHIKSVMEMPHKPNGAHPAADLANTCYKESGT